jgi:hypothetical protein
MAAAAAPSASGRSTSVYLTGDEYARLQEAADQAGVAANAVVRIALRRLLGLPRVSSSRVEAILDDLGSTS